MRSPKTWAAATAGALAALLGAAIPASAQFDVTPLGCSVHLTPSSGIAVFGYENPNPVAVEVDLGSDNFVLEPPNVRPGQLSLFAPGRHETAWIATYAPDDPRRRQVTWFLQGATVSVATQPCGGVGGPVNTVPPALTGTPQVGQVVGVDPGSWAGLAAKRFAWYLDACDPGACAPLAGPIIDVQATGPATVVVPASAAGQRLRARVYAFNSRGLGIAVSALGDPVAGTAAPVMPPPPLEEVTTPQPARPVVAPAMVRSGDPLAADVAWTGTRHRRSGFAGSVAPRPARISRARPQPRTSRATPTSVRSCARWSRARASTTRAPHRSSPSGQPRRHRSAS